MSMPFTQSDTAPAPLCCARKTRGAHQAGLTLVEMILSLAAIGLIGGAIASMLAAVAYGTDESQDLRDLVVKGKTLGARATAAVRSSRTVLEADSDYVVLWITDADGDGTPSLKEIQRIEREADNNAVVSYEAPDDASDIEYELDDDFDDETQDVMGTDDFPRRVWAQNVSDWYVTLDADDAQNASLVSFRFTLSAGTLEHVAVNAAALRN